jgi:hypothetical protein
MSTVEQVSRVIERLCTRALEEFLGIELTGAHVIKRLWSALNLLHRIAGCAGVSMKDAQQRGAVERRVAMRIYSVVRQSQSGQYVQ